MPKAARNFDLYMPPVEIRSVTFQEEVTVLSYLTDGVLTWNSRSSALQIRESRQLPLFFRAARYFLNRTTVRQPNSSLVGIVS